MYTSFTAHTPSPNYTPLPYLQQPQLLLSQRLSRNQSKVGKLRYTTVFMYMCLVSLPLKVHGYIVWTHASTYTYCIPKFLPSCMSLPLSPVTRIGMGNRRCVPTSHAQGGFSSPPHSRHMSLESAGKVWTVLEYRLFAKLPYFALKDAHVLQSYISQCVSYCKVVVHSIWFAVNWVTDYAKPPKVLHAQLVVIVIVFFWWQVPELNLLTALLTAMIDGTNSENGTECSLNI